MPDLFKEKEEKRLANAYIKRVGVPGNIRFDVISLVGTEEPFQITHFEGAFNPYSVSYWR